MFVLHLLLTTNRIQINIKANNTYKNQRQCGQYTQLFQCRKLVTEWNS
jgi:hypothetical protein